MERPSSLSPRKRGSSNPRRVWGIGFFAILGAFFTIGSACSNQGEGERCEVLNNNEDCNTDQGLICYPEKQLANAGSDRCCPLDRSKATQTVCKTSIEVGGAGDATAPADTGPPPTTDGGTSDAADDAPSDAGGDADADQ